MKCILAWLNPLTIFRHAVTVFRRSNPFILLTVMILTGFSLLAVFTTGRHLDANPFYYFNRQFQYLFLGLAALLILALVDYSTFRFRSQIPYVITVLLLAAVLIIGNEAWLNLGRINIQPSELGKLVIILYISYVMAFRRLDAMNFWSESLPIMTVSFSLIAFTLLQPDFGTAMVMTAITIYMLLSTGFPCKHLMLPVIPFVPLAIIIPFRYPYIMSRYINFIKNISPRSTLSCLGFHDYHMRMAMGNGGFSGLGFGNGIVKRSFLPASHTDSIFTVLVEEGGFLTGVFIILLFLALAWLGESTARSAKDRFGTFLARGITFYFTGQAFLNISICLGLLPNTGVTLPFLSYGGSSLIVSLAAVGILINVSSQRQMII